MIWSFEVFIVIYYFLSIVECLSIFSQWNTWKTYFLNSWISKIILVGFKWKTTFWGLQVLIIKYFSEFTQNSKYFHYSLIFTILKRFFLFFENNTQLFFEGNTHCAQWLLLLLFLGIIHGKVQGRIRVPGLNPVSWQTPTETSYP